MMTSPNYILRPEWKEMLWYIEGENKFCFQCGWGATPGDISVPPAEEWDGCVPPFMRGRRDEIIERLKLFDHSTISMMKYPKYKDG